MLALQLARASCFHTNVSNGCTAVGLSRDIPRTQNHWASMISFVTTTLNSPSSTYFAVMPGISRPTSSTQTTYGATYGNQCIGNIMNYDNCQGMSAGPGS